MLGSRIKSEQRKYARAKIVCPVKLILSDNSEYNETTEEISYLGFDFYCDLAAAIRLLPDGVNNLSRANPIPCQVELSPENDEAILLDAYFESVARLSQDEFKITISFDDATLNFDNYQKFKRFIEAWLAN